MVVLTPLLFHQRSSRSKLDKLLHDLNNGGFLIYKIEIIILLTEIITIIILIIIKNFTV